MTKFNKQPAKPVAAQQRVPTHYEMLGCMPTATQDQLRQAFMALAEKLHPDKLLANSAKARKMHAVCAFGKVNPDCTVCKATREFAVVTAAYTVVKDIKRRKAYDATLRLTGRPCGKCNGRGSRNVGFSGNTKKCEECDGTGQQQ
jgi:DnaJ-class molecular chaperone